MGVSVIIINYKSAELILDCLETLFSQSETDLLEVIIVDNHSGDDSEQMICKAFPQVRWLQMGYNSGFARANNAGIQASQHDIVLLLNPDTLIQGNAVVECYHRFRGSEYVACAVQLLNADGSPQITGNYFMTGGMNHLMALPYLGPLIRWVGLNLKVKKTNVPEAKGVVEVDWINGAFLMVKKQSIEKAGLLDEDFFLYSEEIEWCSRLYKIGKMCVYGDLHVVHLQGESAAKAFGSKTKGYQNLYDRKGLQVMLSGLVRIRKQYGVGWFFFHFAAHFASVIVSLIITLLKTIIYPKQIGREWNRWWLFSKNVLTEASYFFIILSNKPYFYKIL